MAEPPAKNDLAAVLICGENELEQGLHVFREFLLEDLSLDNSSVHTIFIDRFLALKARKRLKSIFKDLKSRGSPPVVLVYQGHGNEDGMYRSSMSWISYRTLGNMLKSYPGNFIFINESCSSGAAFWDFEESGLLSEKGLLIAAARPYEDAYSSILLKKVVGSYRAGRRFEERELGTITEGLVFSDPNPEGNTYETILEDGSTYGVVRDFGIFERRTVRLPVPDRTFTHYPIKIGRDLEHLLIPKPLN